MANPCYCRFFSFLLDTNTFKPQAVCSWAEFYRLFEILSSWKFLFVYILNPFPDSHTSFMVLRYDKVRGVLTFSM